MGMLKLIFHFDILEVLGNHCSGVKTSQIVDVGDAIMHQSVPANNLRYF